MQVSYSILLESHAIKDSVQKTNDRLSSFQDSDGLFIGTILEVSMDNFIEMPKKHIYEHQPNFGGSVLTLLYEAYSECNRLDDPQIKADFEELYRLMNGIPLREMDKIIYPVCKLCRDHERTGSIEGIKIGMLLKKELSE